MLFFNRKAIAFAEEKIDLLMSLLDGLKSVSQERISRVIYHGGFLILPRLVETRRDLSEEVMRNSEKQHSRIRVSASPQWLVFSKKRSQNLSIISLCRSIASHSESVVATPTDVKESRDPRCKTVGGTAIATC